MLALDDALLLFGGRLNVRPDAYPEDPEGWAKYLRAVAGTLRHYEPGELITPVRGGLMLPPRGPLWGRLALHALFADRFRDEAHCPVQVRYAWRSEQLNSDVKGAPKSDHLRVALDLKTLGDHAEACASRARDRLVEALWSLPGLSMGLGEGKTITHVGLLSASGKRRWRY